MLAPKPSQATQLASARGVAAPLSLPIAPHRIQNLQPREAGLLPFPSRCWPLILRQLVRCPAPGLWMDLRLVDPGPQMQPRRATQFRRVSVSVTVALLKLLTAGVAGWRGSAGHCDACVRSTKRRLAAGGGKKLVGRAIQTAGGAPRWQPAIATR